MADGRRARVLMVHNYSSWGGNLATVLALCRGLPARGFGTALAAPAAERYVSRFRAAAVPVFDVEIKGKYDIWAIRRYFTLVRGEGFDIVHTHTRRADFVAALAGRLAGAAVVSTQHGQINLARDTLAVKDDFAARFYSFCLRKLFDRHVAVSAEIGDELGERCGVRAEVISRIPNGLDVAPFDAAAAERRRVRRELGAPRWAVVATVVASLDAKGHRDLLPAVAEVVARGVDLRLVVVGEGHWGGPQIRKAAAQLGIARRVTLLGFRDDVPRLLAGSDIFVLPTPSEGLSVAILEAMAAALPVITTPVGGNTELVEPERTGLLVPVGDVRAWTEALYYLARAPELRRAMGQAGRARVAWEFTVEKMLDGYAQMYEGLLRARGRRS